LPTTQYQIVRDYLVRYVRRVYGLRPFELHVTLTDDIKGLLERVGASEEALRRGSLSFQADEPDPKITVEVGSEAEALKVVGESTQTKRLNATGDTDFNFLLYPKVAEDLTFVVRLKYTRTALQSQVSKETAEVITTEAAGTTTKKTETNTHKISSQEEAVELTALTLTCSVRSLLGLTGSQLSIVSKLGTFLFTTALVIVWRLAFPASFDQAQAFGYLALGLASALGLTIVDPSKVRLPWVPGKKETAQVGR
jgi:hypothetical protein